MGREEEIEYARKHGIPVKGGTEITPYSIDDNLWGRSSEGRWIEDLDARARRRRLPARHAARAGARRAADRARSTSSAASRSRVDGERLELVELLERVGRDRLRARRRDRRPHRGPDRRPEGARHLRGPGRGDHPARPRRAREARRHDPPEPVQAELDRQWAYLVYAGLWWEPLRGDLDAYMDRVNEQVTGDDRAQALQGLGARRHARVAERGLRRSRWRRSPSPAGCSPSRRRRASSSCGRCSRAWPTACASAGRGMQEDDMKRTGSTRHWVRHPGRA